MTIKFVSLPFDIVFHVLELLTVKDIIRLEQVRHGTSQSLDPRV